MGKLKILIGLFVLLLVLLFVIEANKPKPIDWTESFNRNHKRPWGTYVLFNELDTIFNNANLEVIKTTPYEKLKKKYNYTTNTYGDNSTNRAYLFINKYINIDDESTNKLLDFVDLGNTVFMSATSFPNYLKDTLNFKLKRKYYYSYRDTLKKEMYLTNRKFNKEQFFFNKGFEGTYIDSLDLNTSTILGYQYYDEEEYINYVKINFGEGEFLIHLQPFSFTNYNMLKDNHANYATNILSYIDAENLYWDSKTKSDLDISDNSLRYILKQPALKWAWRLSWLGIIIFIIFRAKRRQRIVPIINKLPNTSVAFAKTIGNMYFNLGQPKDIVSKKITFFLAYIRKTYLLDTQNLNDEFKKRLHLKTGVPKEEINRLINYIIGIKNDDEVKENSLVTLNKLIEKFYKKTKL